MTGLGNSFLETGHVTDLNPVGIRLDIFSMTVGATLGGTIAIALTYQHTFVDSEGSSLSLSH